MKPRWIMSLCFGVAVLACAIAWRRAVSSEPIEPNFAGKGLSWWIDDLCKHAPSTRKTDGTNQIAAIRAIGTNAIPWLLREYHLSESRRGFAKRLNKLFQQEYFWFRLRESDYHIYRATVGFKALGEIAQPAIPELLSMVEANPKFVAIALSGIGRPAAPALLQCLTNTMLSNNTQRGVEGDVPLNAISALYYAASEGLFSKSDAAIFLPSIAAWASQRTNGPAQAKAQYFLDNYRAFPYE